MTDDESFSDILASFPFTTDDLRLLYQRANNLLGKAQSRPPQGYADGTLDPRSWRQLQQVKNALWSLLAAAEDLETDRDPKDDDIPF